MPRIIKTSWTLEHEARLIRMAEAGASAVRISAALNRPINGIRAKARLLGIDLPTTREVRAKLRELGLNK